LFGPAPRGPAEAAPAAGSEAATSVKPFHVPHSGQRPSHRGSWCPHVEHSKMLFCFATAGSLARG
jgi:hypothetical protein